VEHLLFEFALRALLIAAGTAVLRICRVKMAAPRHSAWAGVVILMMLLPAWTAWGPKASWRVLPPVPRPAASRAAVPAQAFPEFAAPSLEAIAPPAQPRAWNWPICAAVIYLLGVCVLLARLALGTVRAHLLVRRAANRGCRLTSVSCAAPVTVGWFTPTVILPECWHRWPQAQLDAVLAHEGEHARRRDPLVQWLALLNRAIFWFHPLAWWLERRLSALAEEACDAAVLARGCDPFEYSEYLLEMARSVLRTGARVNVIGMAMPGSSLPRRIRRILEQRPAPRISRVRVLCMAAACALTSAIFTAGAVDRQLPAPQVLPPTLAAPEPPAVAPFQPHPAPPARQKLLAQVQAAPAATPPEDKYKDHRLLVLYFDLTAMPAIDRPPSFAAAQEFVRTKMQSNDLLAILTANAEVKVIQDFTADHNQLLRTLDQLMADSGTQSGAGVDADRELTQLHTAVNMLAPLPGRKAVICFVRPPVAPDSAELRPLIDAAIRANVAFQTVDSSGLMETQPPQVDEALRKLRQLAQRQQQLAGQLKDGQQPTAEQRWQQEMLRREAEQLRQTYVIGAGDVLQLSVIGQQGISGSYTVRPDGIISVPLAGNIKAAGLTTSQLQAVIADRLEANGILDHPTVTVGVAEIHR